MASHPTDTVDPLEQYDELVMTDRAPDPAEFAARFPGHPDLLQRIERLEQLRGELDGAARTLSGHGSWPRRIAGFELVETLGEGGMGRVFRARRLADGMSCAVKLGRHTSEAAMRRYRSEARVAAALVHPGIARVVDFGVEGEYAYLATELVEGRSLRQLLDAGDLTPPRDGAEVVARLALAEAVAAALAYAHGQDVVHRDVKPSNVMLRPDGAPLLIDFGIALPLQRAEHSRITRTGVFVGTHNYAAPEQVKGDRRRIGPWTDTYGLAATLYELLAGRPPFQCATHGARLARVEELPARRAPELNPAVPRDVDDLVLRGLSPRPGKRFRDGERMRRALEKSSRRLRKAARG